MKMQLVGLNRPAVRARGPNRRAVQASEANDSTNMQQNTTLQDLNRPAVRARGPNRRAVQAP